MSLSSGVREGALALLFLQRPCSSTCTLRIAPWLVGSASLKRMIDRVYHIQLVFYYSYIFDAALRTWWFCFLARTALLSCFLDCLRRLVFGGETCFTCWLRHRSCPKKPCVLRILHSMLASAQLQGLPNVLRLFCVWGSWGDSRARCICFFFFCASKCFSFDVRAAALHAGFVPMIDVPTYGAVWPSTELTTSSWLFVTSWLSVALLVVLVLVTDCSLLVFARLSSRPRERC